MGLRRHRPGYSSARSPFVENNIELILIGIVAVSVAPIAVQALRSWRRQPASTLTE
nr:hypothetical protein [Phytohabitans suffuscus]